MIKNVRIKTRIMKIRNGVEIFFIKIRYMDVTRCILKYS